MFAYRYPSLNLRSLADLDPSTVAAPQTVDGAALWLFLVDDGGSDLVASTEGGGYIKIRRLDPTSPGIGTWHNIDPEVASYDGLLYKADDTVDNYDGWADHWHIFAHGYHWIALSLISQIHSTVSERDEDAGVGVLLLRFEMLADGSPDTSTMLRLLVRSPTSASDYWSSATGSTRPDPVPVDHTNDLFMVKERAGVVIWLKHNPMNASADSEDDDGTTLIHVSTDGTTWWDEAFWGPGYPNHQALGSATRVWGTYTGSAGTVTGYHYRILAPDLGNSHSENTVYLIEAEEDWTPISSVGTALLHGTDTNYTMVAEARTPSGWRAVVARRGWLGHADPAKRADIALYVFDPDGDLLERHVLAYEAELGEGIDGYFRPHIIYWQSQAMLVVTWDSVGAAYVWTYEVPLA